MRILLSALASVSMLWLSAQTITGKVYDQVNKKGLEGASVQLVGLEAGAATGPDGVFELNGVNPGRYLIKASYVGYAPQIISDIWVKSGKVTMVDFALDKNYTGLEEVQVTQEVLLSEPGKIRITEEQINRFAATYYDPARLATSSADVAVANDQNNEVSVRGISPAYNTWRLEGAEVVNPNHLSNAGTFTDQPTATGGGVNMLSAQMLDRSAFLYSTFDNSYSNSVGGIFDMHINDGNKLDRQYTAQASLIGFDLATEGPFKKSGNVTYAANYRYSFTGLLTQFGVDFGGESIGFQDLALNVSIPMGDNSKLKLFGVGGLSSNDFEHKTVEESEVEKDRKDIYYNNKTGIIGASFSSSFDNSSFSAVLTFSGLENERSETVYENNVDEVMDESVRNTNQSILSFHPSYNFHLNRQNVSVGAMVNRYYWLVAENTSISAEQWLAQPYVRLNGPLGNKFKYHIGATTSLTSEDYTIEPRGQLTYLLNPYHSISLGSGIYSMLLNPFNYNFSNPYGAITFPTEFELITSWRNTLSYLYERDGFNIGAELFYYDFPDVYLTSLSSSAETYGITVSSEKASKNNFYYRLGGSLFKSDILGTLEDNQYDNRYNLSLATGKQWDFTKKAKERSLSVNGRILFQGGQYFPELEENGVEVLEPYQTDPYFRFDLRVQWTWYRSNRTSSLALDLQNAIGYENEAYQYYDNFTRAVETQYQLGLIPILTYRVEW